MASRGRSLSSRSGVEFDVINPATGQRIASVPDMGAERAEEVVYLAKQSQSQMAALTAEQRSGILFQAAEKLRSRAEQFADLVSTEAGKPRQESLAEVAYSASLLRWFAAETGKMYGRTIPTDNVQRRLHTILQPVGVAALLTPWNFPIAMLARKAGAAIAAGCPVVMKPAEDTPLSAMLFRDVLNSDLTPPGAVGLVTCSREKVEAVGTVLATSGAVSKLSFTGSTAVGLHLNALAAHSAKRVSLELGGNAPLIVFGDADVEAAVEATVASRFRNSGQTCVCTNRVYVADSVYEAFVERLCARVANLRIGFDPAASDHATSDLGPLINARAVQRAQAFVDSAVQAGATVAVGGRGHVSGWTVRRVGDAATPAPAEPGTCFFEPVVLLEATQDMRVVQEETFAPILPVLRFSGGEEEAVELGNHASAGLAAYAFTQDLGRAYRVSEALQFGMVGINQGVISTAVAPFGGVKLSGLGREGGAEGVFEYCNVKYVAMGV